MYMFDTDRSGTISYAEFRRILKLLGGVKTYSKDKLIGKKGKKAKEGKDKSKKDKKSGKIKDVVGHFFWIINYSLNL